MAARANSTPGIRLAGADPGPVDGPFHWMGAKGWWTCHTATRCDGLGAAWRAFVGKILEDADRSRVARTAYRRVLRVLRRDPVDFSSRPAPDPVPGARGRATVCVGGKPRTGLQSMGRIIGAYTEVLRLDACVRYKEVIGAMTSHSLKGCSPEIELYPSNIALEVMACRERAIMRNKSHQNVLEYNRQASVR